MAKRYLMRLGKTPFDAVDAFHTLDRNTLGTNNGNLIYGAASHKLFSTKDTVVDANHYQINGGMADRVNDEYDAFIVPLADAFRPTFEAELLRTTEFIERLKIPVLMMSGGAKLAPNGDPSELAKIEPTVKRFARAVLEKSSALSVRGEMSAEYLRGLGFKDVVVVGCPSMMIKGRDHRVEVPPTLEPGLPIAYNMETKSPFGGDLVEDAERSYDATYMPQENGTLELMLWATSPYTAADSRLPLELSHPQFTGARAEFYLDVYPWLDRLADMAFSFGPRAHGNIAATLAGTPSVMLTHDGRTTELARYHGIPHVTREADPYPASVEELYALADFTEYNRGHAERFDRLSDFIHDNGFTHIYDAGQEDTLAAYEEKIAATTFPAPVKSSLIDQPPEDAERNAVLQERNTGLKKSLAQVRGDLNKRHRQTSDQIAQLTKRLDAAEKRATEAEERASEAQQRTDAAEKRATTVEKKVAELGTRLIAVSKDAKHANDRAQRALRIPSKAKKAIARDQPPTQD